MKRAEIIEAIRAVTTRRNYKFHTGFEYRINSELKELPAAWLLPLKVTKKEGRNEGELHYQATLKLIARCTEYDAKSKEQKWAEMERDALLISQELESAECINYIASANYEISEFSLTNRGELAATLQLKIVAPFYPPN